MGNVGEIVGKFLEVLYLGRCSGVISFVSYTLVIQRLIVSLVLGGDQVLLFRCIRITKSGMRAVERI